MASDPQHCSFVLLAEFDILRGAQLTYQFPQPLGTDEWCVRVLELLKSDHNTSNETASELYPLQTTVMWSLC